jgi:hypothetical protein
VTTDIVYFWGSYDNFVPGNNSRTPTPLSRLGTGSVGSQGICTMVNAENGWFSFLNANGTSTVPFGFGGNRFAQINQTGQDPIFPNPEQVGATTGSGVFAWTASAGSGGPVGGPATYPFVQTDGGGEFAIHLDAAGNLFSNGTDTHGQLGINNSVFPTTYAVPQRVFGVGGAGFLALKAVYGAISGGSDHWIGLQPGGTVVACGSSQYGQCGDGLSLAPGGTGGGFYAVPVQVVKGAQAGTQYLGDTTPISYVSVGDKQSMALESGGMHVFAWGRNDSGQLGIGTSGDVNNSSSPVDVTPFLVAAGATLPIAAISAGGGVINGDGHGMVIDHVGKLFAFGDNASGQIGTGTLSPAIYPTPQLVSVQWSGTIVAASAGGDHSMALDSTGDIWTWGADGNGQLGRLAGSGSFPTPGQVTLFPANLVIDLIFAGNQTSVVHGTQPPPPPVRFTRRRNLAGFFSQPFKLSGSEALVTVPITLGFGGTYVTPGHAIYTSVTGNWILDFWPRVATAYDGLTPSLDLLTNVPTNQNGVLVSQGLSPFPLWVQDTSPGNNSGLLVPGTPTGPRASEGYAAALQTAPLVGSAPPVQRAPIFVAAGGSVYAVISQDGTAQAAVAASLTAATPVTFPLVVNSTNDQWIWFGTDPQLGGGGLAGETFTVASNTYNSLNTTAPQLLPALNAATGSLSAEAFDTYATFTVAGGLLVVTNNVAGAAGNGNMLDSGGATDIVAQLGFVAPLTLGPNGAGGDPGSSVGICVINLLIA